MFDQERFQDALADYKKKFVSFEWEKEKYKWEAVQWFQDHWDIHADDFAGMLKQSLAKTDNLLASRNHLPRGMIEEFADTAPEEVRAMFMDLYDESRDVYERIDNFKNQSAVLLTKYGNGAAQHFQGENPISVYLWLRYPDRYYIYKYSEAKCAAETLQSSYEFHKGAYTENLHNLFDFYSELCEALKQDPELNQMFQSCLTDTCYPDPERKTLTVDFGFYVSRYFSDQDSNNGKDGEDIWEPVGYDPGLSVNDWKALLVDHEVFTDGALEIMKRMKDYGGKATARQLAVRYGEPVSFYLTGSEALAERVADKTGCKPNENGNPDEKWWPILYIGKKDSDNEGSWIWKLQDALSAALDQTDLSQVKLYADEQNGEKERHYWWLNANPKMWSFSGLAVGEEQSYTLYNENGNKRRIFQNFIDAREGDPVIGYESYPVKQVVALAKVSSPQDGKELYFEKTEGLTTPIDYAALKECPELSHMEYFVNPQGSLFKLTKAEYDFIMDMIRDENPLPEKEKADTYTKQDFLNEVYMPESRYNMLTAVLENKKNIILQGAPGVGKTFAAKRLAYSMMGEKDETRIEFVQFHQNYSYEDFIMGYKPAGDGFELRNGIFYRFCQKAANQPDRKFFFIIDEINRGNLSKIFGELLMLIEKPYRGKKVTLAYSGLPFSVPENLYLIGMMNTADRSLAMIDYALRRRFSFFEMRPAFDSEGFLRYQKQLHNETFDALIEKVKDLNRAIEQDRSLGRGFCIGHSYFCGQEVCTEEWMRSVVDFDIIPMLEEYWFDNETELQRWTNILNGVFQ